MAMNVREDTVADLQAAAADRIGDIAHKTHRPPTGSAKTCRSRPDYLHDAAPRARQIIHRRDQVYRTYLAVPSY
jgi:hypothetical protein